MAELPTGTVTFLFSDIQGSTQLLKDLGRERYGELLAKHNELLRAAFVGAGGIEIDRQGDSFFAVFRSAGAAVSAAIDGQRALAAAEWPDSSEVRVRMGIHTGEASYGDDGYVGFAVHKASRVGDAGYGGQVLLSSTTAGLIEHDLPRGVTLRDLGESRLDGLDRPERLHQLVVDGLPAVFPELATRSATHAAPGVAPLLEREAELAALRAMIELARTGNGRVVVIEGDAGMGKTRLVTEARALAAAAGLRVLSARGGELEHEFSYGVVRQLFEPTLALADPSDREEMLSGAAALSAPLFDERSLGDGGTVEESSFSTLHGLFWLAGNLAARQPLVLTVDDLHWADAASLRWLTYAARRLEGLPILIIVGTRPAEQSSEPSLVMELVADPAGVVIRPPALTVLAATELIREFIARDVDVEFADACHATTGGNPLLLRALLEALRDVGVAPKAKNAPVVHEIGPEAVARSVHLRLGRLPAEATQLSRAVAVLGDDVSLSHAAALAELDRDVAAHTATTLVRNGLMRMERTLRFVHPVVRAAVYADLNPAEREAAHARAANLLAGQSAPVEQIAAHVLLTPPGIVEACLPCLRKAAERAVSKGDPHAASSYLRRAVQEELEPEERGQMLFSLGMAERLIDRPEAAQHLREAHALTADPRQRGEVALQLGRMLFYGLQLDEAVRVHEEAIAAVGDEDLDLLRRLEGGLLSVSMIFPPLYPLARTHLERARTLPLDDDIGSKTLLAMFALEDSRSIGAPREVCKENAERALAGGDLFAADNPGFVFATVALTIGDEWDTAEAIYDDAFADARLRGSISGHAIASIFRGYMYLFTGELAAAESDLQNAMTYVDEHGLQSGISYAVSFLADAQMGRGDLDAAGETLLRLETAPAPSREHWVFYDSRGRLRFIQGRYREALADFMRAGEIFSSLGGRNPTYLSWRSQAALAHLRLEEREEAERFAAEELELARLWGAPRGIAKALRVVGTVEGGKRGIDTLREAVAQLEGSRAILERARGLLELGSALRRGNQRAEAREHLRLAVELAHQGEAAVLAERAQQELMATGAKPRRLAISGVESLTPSERRVAAMAASEMTNRDIAQALFVTPKTIEVHLSSVYRKLGIASRAQLRDALGSELAAPAPA